jgi:acyl carrier protein
MTEEEIRATFIEELVRIAPDIAPEDIEDNDHLQDDLGLDSMDVLNLVTALHGRLGVDIPEVDYPKLSTLPTAITYLSSNLN